MDEQKDKRVDLVRVIQERRAHAIKHGRRNYRLAQLLIAVAILSSFVTAIISATDKLKWAIPVLAAIPGTVLLADKSFSFGRRARWHYTMHTKLDQLAHGLNYEDATVEETSKQLSRLLMEMQESFPGLDPHEVQGGAGKN